MKTPDLIPSALIDAFRAEKVILFVGAGLSRLDGHGYPDASKLADIFCEEQVQDQHGEVRPLREILGNRPYDLPEIAEYLEQRAEPGVWSP